MLDADVHDDGGMHDGREDPRAYAKGSLLYFILHQNPDIEAAVAPFIRKGTDLSPFISVSQAENRGDNADQMELEEIGYDRMLLSYKLEARVNWLEFSQNVLRTSYGKVDATNTYRIHVQPELLEQALCEMEDDQINYLLSPLLSQEPPEPWRESLEPDETRSRLSAFLGVQRELVQSLVEIQPDLARDVHEELQSLDDPSEIIAVFFSLFNERTHRPIGNMSMIDSPESLLCEFGGQVRWSPATYSDSTMPKGMILQRWRMADMNIKVLLEATDRMPLDSRRILAHELARAAEVQGLRSIGRAKATEPGFDESGIYTRTLRARLNEAYHRIALAHI